MTSSLAAALAAQCMQYVTLLQGVHDVQMCGACAKFCATCYFPAASRPTTFTQIVSPKSELQKALYAFTTCMRQCACYACPALSNVVNEDVVTTTGSTAPGPSPIGARGSHGAPGGNLAILMLTIRSISSTLGNWVRSAAASES